MSSFMSGVKESVTRELMWPDSTKGPWSESADEDWRRVAVGVIRAGGAIVPRSQVRVMGSFLRLLEDEYLRVNHLRARSGEFAAYNHFRAQEVAVLDIMIQVREIIRGT
jgi:hypothetical protein